VDELEDLINRLTHLSFHDKADPPSSAVLILTRREISIILNSLAALKATDQVVGGFVENHWMPKCQHWPKDNIFGRFEEHEGKPKTGELCNQCLAKDKKSK